MPYFSQYIQNVKITQADNEPAPGPSRAGGATSTEGVTVVGEGGGPLGMPTAQTRTTESTTSETPHHKMPHWSLSTPLPDEETRAAESSPVLPTSGAPRQHQHRSATF